jgi:hypothetical protein
LPSMRTIQRKAEYYCLSQSTAALGELLENSQINTTMSQKPKRARRRQPSVPGSNEKMPAKAASSAADHVFCDLGDEVACNAKLEARGKTCWALNNLEWGTKTRCVRINDDGRRGAPTAAQCLGQGGPLWPVSRGARCCGTTARIGSLYE